MYLCIWKTDQVYFHVISACFTVGFVAEFATAVLTSRDFSGMKIQIAVGGHTTVGYPTDNAGVERNNLPPNPRTSEQPLLGYTQHSYVRRVAD